MEQTKTTLKMGVMEISDEAWAKAVAEATEWQARKTLKEVRDLQDEMIRVFGPRVGQP